MKKICVLAGDREQYERWLEENGQTSSTAAHVFDERSAQGCKFSEIVTVGTFWSRQDALDLHQIAATRLNTETTT